MIPFIGQKLETNRVMNTLKIILIIHSLSYYTYAQRFLSGKTKFCDSISVETQIKLSALAKKINNTQSADSLLFYFGKLKIFHSIVNKEIPLLNLTNGNISWVDSCKIKTDLIIPYLKLDYAVEGTMLLFTINNKNLLNRALITKGKNDDKLFALLVNVWGEAGESGIGFPRFMTKMTDLSGYSNIGDGLHTLLLKKIYGLRKENNPILIEETNQAYMLIIENLNWPICLGNSKEKAIKEMQNILKSKYLRNETDRKKLKVGIENIQSGKFQSDCKTKNCKFE